MQWKIQEIIDNSFTDGNLKTRTLTRRDWVDKVGAKKKPKELQHQDGLDTLGDAVLNFCIFEHFYDERKSDSSYYNEKRETYGNNDILKKLALEYLHLESAVIWSPNETLRKAWEQEGDKIPLAKCFEALIGGLYRDGGIPVVEKFLEQIEFYQTIDDINNKQG